MTLLSRILARIREAHYNRVADRQRMADRLITSEYLDVLDTQQRRRLIHDREDS